MYIKQTIFHCATRFLREAAHISRYVLRANCNKRKYLELLRQVELINVSD